jgi:L-cysteate sulfo-lyase
MTDPALKQELRRLLSLQPRYPISLLPTPLAELPNLSRALGGPRIFIKRDDMTGLAYGGNKARKLDYFIGEAKAQGCDVFIGGGGAIQSNHALMCAAAARKAGMKPVIFARAGTHHYALQGDYLLTKLLVDGGVHLYTTDIPPSRRHAPTLIEFMNKAADQLRAQGFKPYILPGSGQPSGTLGYVECAVELADQCDEMGIEPDWIFLTSTGGGQAGLLVGSKFLQKKYTVVGCAPGPYGTDAERGAKVAELANRTAQLLGADVYVDPASVKNLDRSGGAYGVPTPDGLEALQLMAHNEGIFLDPVYTSKGVSGMIDQIRKGVVRPTDTVIYIHTGGGPLNFVYSNELAGAFDLSLESDEIMSLD